MKKFLILIMLLAIAAFAFADVVIGSGTSTQYYPMSTYYNYYRSATLYTAAEINASGTITNLKWYCGTANTTTSFPIKIYLKHSPLTVLTADTWANYSADATEVYSATIPINTTGWFNFDITDFAYNGTDNLMVLVDSGSAAYVSPYVKWRYTTTATNMFVGDYEDGAIPTNLTTSTSRPNITFVGITTPVAPGATTLVSPTDTATGVSKYATLNWNPSSGATSYKLYFGTDNPPTNIVNGTDLGNVLTYSPTMNFSTTYYWSVVPKNIYGDATGCPVWSFTTMADPTVTTYPWTENFDTVTTPALPLGWTAIDNNADGDFWKTTTTYSLSSPNAAVLYTDYNAVNDDYLVTPPLVLTGNQRLKFWTRCHSTSEPDEISVLLSTTTPTAGAFTNVLLPTTAIGFTTFAEYTVDLSAFTGTCYISFTRTDEPADGWYLYVDNVLVEDIPTQAIFNLSPDVTSWDFGLAPVNYPSTKIFTISNTGGAPLTINSVSTTGSYYSISVSPALMTIPALGSTSFTVQYLPTVTGGPYTGTLDISFAREIRTVNLTGSAYEPATLPLTEGFEAGFGDWTVVNGTEVNAWYAGTATYNTGAQSAYISNDGGVTNAYTTTDDTWTHFYKDVAFTSGNYRYELSFNYNCGGESTWDGLKVYIADTSANPTAGVAPTGTQLGATWYNLTTGWTPATINLGNEYAGTVKKLIFSWRSDTSAGVQPPVALDDISLTAVAIMPPNAVTLVSPADDATGVNLTPALTWNAPVGGDAATGYKVYFGTAANPPYLTSVAGLNYTIAADLPYDTEHFWKIVPFNAQGDGTASAIWSFTTMADPDQPAAAPILVGPIDGATDVPVEGPTFTWERNLAGGVVDSYTLFVHNNNTDEGEFFSTEYYYEDVTSPFTPDNIPYDYTEHWFWTVVATSAASPDMFYQWPPNEFVIEDAPIVINTFPYLTDFEAHADDTLPLGWTRSRSGDVATGGWIIGTDYSSTYWAIPAHTVYAATNDDETNDDSSLDILVTPIIDLSAETANYFQLTFDSFYNYLYSATVEVSTDGTNWTTAHTLATNAAWNVVSVDLSAYKLTPFWLRFHYNDNGSWAYGWAIDNVQIAAVPDHDVAVVSYDVLQQVVPENTLVTPMATVKNKGITTETFDVTCTIGTYTSTVTVTGLEFGQTQQVSFTPLTPEVYTGNTVAVTAVLATDQFVDDNSISNSLICLPLEGKGLANNTHTDQFVQFNLNDPTTLYPLATPFAGTNFVSGADWMNGNWMGVNYDDGTLANDFYYNINPVTGAYLPAIGETGAALMGIAWDDTNDVMYGVGNGNLYTVNPTTGLTTVAGTMWYNLEGTPTNFANIGGLMIATAYDNTNNILYGIDLGNDALWTINPTTFELTLVGFFGVNLNYAQDAAFDQTSGMLYLSGYSTFGGLYWVDTTSGAAFLVDVFGTSAYELDGFAIPYGLAPETPVVTISGQGTLTWDPVLGAMSYDVYSSDDPYGTYTLEASVIGTQYTGLAATKKFYKVYAVGGRQSTNHQELRVNTLPRNNGNIGRAKSTNFNTGIAR